MGRSLPSASSSALWRSTSFGFGSSPVGTADNIGSFHQQLYDRLKADKNAERATCFVDPDRPERSLLDRTFRPGMLAFQMIFVIVFGTIGLAVLAYFLTTRQPREIGGRLQIDSANRSSRFSAMVMILYHSMIAMVTIPVVLICLAGGDFYALLPAVLSAAPIALVFFCWRYAFKRQPVTGKLLLPDRFAQGQEVATLLLPASWQGPVDLETRWVIPAPPSNRIGVEDETGASNAVQQPAVGGNTSVTEIELPMPHLPAQIPGGGEIKLEVMGTIGGYRYKDEFTIEDKVVDWLQEKA